MELFREKSDRQTRIVTLEQTEDSSVQIFCHDLGQAVREFYGDSDYETWLTVAPKEIPKLAMALLAEKFGGKSDALSELQKFCKALEIEANFGSF